MFAVWDKHPPLEGGHRALFRTADEAWVLDPTQRPGYYTVLKMFKKLCEFLGYQNPKWTLHSARNWFPTCANQLGWSEDDRRRLGHWAPGSQMMERYDRAICTTELRLRSSILGMITDSKWTPTQAFEVPGRITHPPCTTQTLTLAPTGSNEKDKPQLSKGEEIVGSSESPGETNQTV